MLADVHVNDIDFVKCLIDIVFAHFDCIFHLLNGLESLLYLLQVALHPSLAFT